MEFFYSFNVEASGLRGFSCRSARLPDWWGPLLPGLLLPIRPYLLEPRHPLADLHYLFWVELKHHIAEVQHPFPTRVPWVDGDVIGVRNLNLPPPQCANCQAVPAEKLNWDELDVRDAGLRSIDAVTDHEHREEVAVILVESSNPFNGGQIRHIELRVGTMRLDIDDVIDAVGILECQVRHSSACEAGRVLGTERAK